MRLFDSAASTSLVIALFVIFAVAFLAWRQWRERQSRSPELSDADTDHFSRQDTRRLLGTIVLGLIAVGLVVGTRIPLNPPPSRLIRRFFAGVWMAVILLLLVALVLAWLDIKATRLYARRHRHAIAEERRAFLEDAQRRRAYPGNGRSGPPGPIDGISPH
ncbi:MAG TPA: hypothetical protein VGZ22_08020 [Isosphaeraceae bacterium]|jgi:undecaprenyl pyrophosphate phosphatase UppP|nr:hypothetical protein [Isosphaeraceae bacterium]